MKTREPSKCREWEKIRRDKLNVGFAALSKVLPEYDPSKTTKKIEILQKATEHIQVLQKKLDDILLEGGAKSSGQKELKLLYERVKKLLLRNDQLSKLLKDAGIKIPVEYGDVNNFRRFRRFSNKISPEDAKKLADKEAQKENAKDENTEKVSKAKSDNSVKSPNKKPKVVKKSTKKKNDPVNVQLSSILINGSQTITTNTVSNHVPPCFIITGSSAVGLPQPAKCKTAQTVVINSSSLVTPKMASIITPSASTIVSKTNSTLSSLGPGTLILANGSLVPILPQSTPVFTNPTPILLKPPTNNTTLIVMSSNNAPKSASTTSSTLTSTSAGTRTAYTKTFTPITPKTGLTKTTQVNKVPIPALTSRYSDLLIEKSKANIKNDKKVLDANASKKVSTTTKTKAAKRKLPNSNDTSSFKRVKTHTPAVHSKVLQTKSTTIENNLTETPTVNKNTVTLVDVSKKSLSNDNEPTIENRIEKENDGDPENSSKSISQVVNLESTNLSTISKKDEAGNKCKELTKEVNNEAAKDSQQTQQDKSNDSDPKDQLQENQAARKLDKRQELTNSNLQAVNQLVPCDNSAKPVANEVCSVQDDKVKKVVEEKVSEVSAQKECLATEVSKPAPPCSVATVPVSVASNLIEINNSSHTEVSDKTLELNLSLHHSELSNDIFSSLQVPIGGQNPESTSPTAAFLLAFPLVSSLTGVKVTEVIEEENSDSRHGTPNLLQIGTMDITKTTQSVNSESLTPNLLNLDSFSYFSSKDMCNSFYSSFDNPVYPTPISSNSLDVKPSCESRKSLDTKQLKVLPEAQLQIKHQAFSTSANLHNMSQNTLTTSNPPAVAYMEPQVSKSNAMPQHNFVRENASISYSKPSSMQSSYIQDPLSTNTQIHYDEKLAVTTSTSTCKDVNILNYSTANKKVDLIQTSNQYSVAASNSVSMAQLNAFNPFSDFSKSSSFSKSYSDPLYTNSSHYNYPQHNVNNFEQNYYNVAPKVPVSKTNPTPYVGSNYPDYSMDCKANNSRKREPTNQRHNSTYYPQTKVPVKDKFAHSAKVPKSNNVPKPPINWMTTPDFRPHQPSNSDYLVPAPFNKDTEYNPNSFYSSSSLVSTTHTTYFNATSSMYNTPDFQNTDNRNIGLLPTNAPQKNEFEENQFAWSPTKLPQFLETPHSFVSSTLPTLVGDLALGTTQTPFGEQKVEHANKKDSSRRSKVPPAVNYDNQSTFLSVSQLVESKTNLDNSSRGNRRNSGNRTVKASAQKASKHKPEKDLVEVPQAPFNTKLVVEKNPKQILPQNMNYNMQGIAEGTNWMPDCNKSNRQVHKNSHNYSAEALIGHQEAEGSISKQRYKQQPNYTSSVNKTIPIPSFLSDNIVPYFPPVEIGQDNNFMQSNLNYQNSFQSSVQNNTYPTGTYISTGATITSSYLQPSGLLPEFGSHDYSSITDNSVSHAPHAAMDKTSAKHCNRNEVKQLPHSGRSDHHQQINTDCSGNPPNKFINKAKPKHHNEPNMPGIVDLGFLSMPSNINSPTLSDDFHAHSNFLPPPTASQLFPCKNPLYPKQSGDLNSSSLLHLPPVPVTRNATQHFENAPVGNNAGTSLTSFNLSAIFPEINKGSVPLPGLYPESSRSKNYNFQRNYLGGPTQQ